MKKILPILVVLALFISATPIVLADDFEGFGDDIEGIQDVPKKPCAWKLRDCHKVLPTSATIAGTPGGGSGGDNNGAPIIKCKWEYDMDVEVPIDECGEPCDPCEDSVWKHDACCCIPGLQVKPHLYGNTNVGFFAVVTDPEGVDHVEHVYADVWHPDGSFKYQIELFPVGFDAGSYNRFIALDIWNHTWAHHSDLVKFSGFTPQQGFTQPEDVYEEILQEEAYLYKAVAQINYCQPGGWYYVGVRAHDGYDKYCEYLFNRFWYIPTAGIALDFTSVNYGTVAESSNKWVGGDEQFGTDVKPTVRNIGNTPVKLTVKQDDMQFGETAGQSNVEYDVRLTANGPVRTYLPGAYDLIKPEYEGGQDEEGNRYCGVLIPGILDLCTEEKLDFSIHVFKGYPGMTYTGTMDICAYVHIPSYIWTTPSMFEKSAPLGVPKIYNGPVQP